MGKITGFLEYERVEERSEPVPARLKTWKEFVITLDSAQARTQAMQLG